MLMLGKGRDERQTDGGGGGGGERGGKRKGLVLFLKLRLFLLTPPTAGGGGGGGWGWVRETARERGLSVFFKCKALPSDTCHRVGTNPLSVWQEVGASRQELKGRVYANSCSQRKWVASVSAWGAK